MISWRLIVKAWLTDNKQVIAWLTGILARGIAWILAAKLGMDATESGTTATGVAEAVTALVLAGVSIYSSVKGRKKLQAEPPK